MQSLEELFERYRCVGDVDALGEVFDRTAPALIRIALHLCGNRPDAEDAVQATYLRAIEAAAGWDPARPLTPWLVGILGNRARHRRAAAARRPLHARLPEPAEAGAHDPLALAARRELGDAVEATIGDLPARYRSVLRLHLLDGRDPNEIAAVLARRPGTVRSQLQRGLRALRRLLPPGFASGMAKAQALAGLPRMREVVMAHAGAPQPAAMVGAGAWLVGGMVMQKLAIGAALAALLVLWLTWGGTTDPPLQSAAPANAERSTALADGASPAITREAPHRVPLSVEEALESERGGEQLGAAPDAGGSLRVHATWRSDGAPAALVPVFVERARSGEQRFGERRAVTDAAGIAYFASLPVGRFRVHGGRQEYGIPDVVEIAPRAETTLDLTLGGVTVTGTVVDAQERPVAGARVCVAASDTRELARTDAAGAFTLRGIGPEVRIGARAAGHAPSRLQRVPAARQGRIDALRLVLPGPGGTLRCAVVDAADAPVRDAIVSVGAPEWRATTDARGQAELDGVPVGELDVRAWAAGASPWRGTAAVDVAAPTELRIQLLPGAVLHGRVRDAAGRPLPGYEVAVNLAASAAYARFGPFAGQHARTNEAGDYRIDGLPAGEIDARASGGGVTASQVLSVRAGESVRWDPVLDVAPGVPGRVVGPDGRGLVAIVEGTSPGRRGWGAFEVTGDDGGFALKNIARGDEVRLDVRVDYFPVTRFVGALPREGELVLQVAAADLPTIRIVGVVVDDADRPVPGAEVLVTRRGYGGSPGFTTGDGGRLDVGPFPSGEYRLSVSAQEHARLVTDWLTIAPGETRDVGTMRLQPAGTLEVHVHASVPLPEELYFQLVDQSGGTDGLEIRAGRGSRDDLPAGHYDLLVFGAGLALARHEFQLASRGRVRLDIAVEVGVPTTLILRADGRPLPKRVTLELAGADGRALLTTTPSVLDDGRVSWHKFGLRPGAYRVRVEVDGRPVGALAFTVPAGAASCRVEVPIASG